MGGEGLKVYIVNDFTLPFCTLTIDYDEKPSGEWLQFHLEHQS